MQAVTYHGHHARVFRRRPIQDGALRQPRVRLRALSTHTHCQHADKNYCDVRMHFVDGEKKKKMRTPHFFLLFTIHEGSETNHPKQKKKTFFCFGWPFFFPVCHERLIENVVRVVVVAEHFFGRLAEFG